MNNWNMWVLALCVVLVGIVVSMMMIDAAHASPQAINRQDYNPTAIVQAAKKWCSDTSLSGSDRAYNYAMRRLREVEADPEADPALKAIIQTNALIAVSNLERLTVQCAIFQRLGYGA